VFAVPGAVTNPLAAAPNALIRDGAALVRGVGDVLEELGVMGVPDESRGAQLTLDLHDADRRALAAVTDRMLPESVAVALGLPVERVLPVLFRLELAGLIRSVGGRFEPRLRRKGSGGAS
jgi:DNA processing protein